MSKSSENSKKWRITHPMAYKASGMVQNYRKEDEKYNRGKCTLTSKWILENILSKPCVHCGETDWRKIGCNRLDNSKPHTKDNVEPCCRKCNHKLACEYKKIIFGKPVTQYSTNNEVIKVFPSIKTAAKELNINYSHIRDCCEGGCFDKRRNKWVNVTQYKGFIWRYKED